MIELNMEEIFNFSTLPLKKKFYRRLSYSPFHKTLSRSSLQMHLISVSFYEMGDTKNVIQDKMTGRVDILWHLLR